MKNRRASLSLRARFTILERDGYRCRYCGQGADAVELEVDHVIPVAAGGKNEPGNLVTACKPCNRGKAAIPDVAPPLATQRHREWIDMVAVLRNDCPQEYLYADPYITSIYGEPAL